MLKKLILICAVLMAYSAGGYAISIKRYVAEGANGDGLTKENPTGNLLKVLEASKQVDELTVYVAPGTYKLPPLGSPGDRAEYRNVRLFGGWSMAEDKQGEEKSVITGDLFINGGLVSGIDFRGSKVGNKVEGYLLGELVALGCNVYNSHVSALVMQVAGGSVNYINGVSAESVTISPYRTGMRGAVVEISDCNFSNGDGLSANSVRLNIRNCSFNHNSNVALFLYNCEGTVVKQCTFKGNKSKGAVCIKELTDEYSAIFMQCNFSNNTSSNADFASAITTYSPIYMEDCMIGGNSSELVAGGNKTDGRHWGAIELNRAESRFYNCTFYGNKDAAIYYNMTPSGHSKIESQFLNCVFLNNRLYSVCPNGNHPLLYMCATDFGSDIPELDAERKILRIDKNTAGMDVMDNQYVFLEEGSPLINAGKNVFYNDEYNISHQLLGGTDIGCVEYMGKWKKSDPEKTITIGEQKYVRIECAYEGTHYYMMVAESNVNEDGTILLRGGLYLGDNLAPVNLLDDTHAITYMTVGGKKTAVLYQLNSNEWEARGIMEYTNLAPTAAKNEKGEWKLKEKTAATRPQLKNSQVRKRSARRR